MDKSKKIPLTERNLPKRTFTSYVNSTNKVVNPKNTKLPEDSKNQESAWMNKRNESWDY